MPRGSKPGERRGGRQKGTPNKKTAFRDAAIQVAAADPNLSPLNFFLSMMRDRASPIATRVAMAHRALPYVHSKVKGERLERPDAQKLGTPSSARNSPRKSDSVGDKTATAKTDTIASKEHAGASVVTPLDFLLHVMRHPDAPPALRLKAASITAPYVHQKRANDGPAKNSITVADKFGMVVDSEVPKKLRDNKFRLLRLSNRRIKHPDEYDRKAPILEARIAAARKQLNCPCPSVYGLKDFSKDHKRLWELSRKRKSRSKLTKAEDTEEVHLTARVEAFAASPEIAARVRMKELQQRQRTAAFAGGHPSV